MKVSGRPAVFPSPIDWGFGVRGRHYGDRLRPIAAVVPAQAERGTDAQRDARGAIERGERDPPLDDGRRECGDTVNG